jgi:hypothetical protein
MAPSPGSAKPPSQGWRVEKLYSKEQRSVVAPLQWHRLDQRGAKAALAARKVGEKCGSKASEKLDTDKRDLPFGLSPSSQKTNSATVMDLIKELQDLTKSKGVANSGATRSALLVALSKSKDESTEDAEEEQAKEDPLQEMSSKTRERKGSIHDRLGTAAGLSGNVSPGMVTISSSEAHRSTTAQANNDTIAHSSRLGRITRLRQNNNLHQSLNLEGLRSPSPFGRHLFSGSAPNPGPVTEAFEAVVHIRAGNYAVNDPMQVGNPLFPGGIAGVVPDDLLNDRTRHDSVSSMPKISPTSSSSMPKISELVHAAGVRTPITLSDIRSAFILLPFAFVSLPFAFVSLPFAFISLPFAFISLPFAFVSLHGNF